MFELNTFDIRFWKRFAEQHFSDTHITTIGVDFKLRTIQVGQTRVKLQVWDTAGQEKFRVITKTYYRNAAGIIIAYDVTNGESFVNTKRWIEEVKNNCGDDGVPIVLVGNKSDAPNKIVSFEDQQAYAGLMNLPFYETSAKENINVDEVFTHLTKLILARQEQQQQQQQQQQQLSGNGASGGRNGHIRLDKSSNANSSSSSKKKCC